MKRVLLLLYSLFMCMFALFAQKVETGTRIINCSDMPAGTYTNVKRRCPVPTHEVSDRLNQTVYQRFEVAKHNYQNSALGVSREDAIRYCASYREFVNDRGKWRLPTQRELLIIWILRPALVQTDDFDPLDLWDVSYRNNSGGYYSATKNACVGFMVQGELDSTPDMSSSSGNGRLSDNPAHLVRCIRDLDIK